jgi:hypothetical protein
MWEESIGLQHNEERSADRERAETKHYDHDEHEPTTYERANKTLMQTLMGEEYDKYFWDEKHSL